MIGRDIALVGHRPVIGGEPRAACIGAADRAQIGQRGLAGDQDALRREIEVAGGSAAAAGQQDRPARRDHVDLGPGGDAHAVGGGEIGQQQLAADADSAGRVDREAAAGGEVGERAGRGAGRSVKRQVADRDVGVGHAAVGRGGQVEGDRIGLDPAEPGGGEDIPVTARTADEAALGAAVGEGDRGRRARLTDAGGVADRHAAGRECDGAPDDVAGHAGVARRHGNRATCVDRSVEDRAGGRIDRDIAAAGREGG